MQCFPNECPMVYESQVRRMPSSSSFAGARQTLETLAKNIESVIIGQRHAVRKLLACFAGSGHALLEDVPGTGKTTLAKTFARSMNAAYTRVQFTPDLLPSDILGVSIFDQRDQSFKLHRGPIFTNILLGDEINRASPRTQSALLEAMGEEQVSIDGVIHLLAQPFFVIATQNPADFHGTYPLPESQMDRFAMCFSMGYVGIRDEVAILTSQLLEHPLEKLSACCDLRDALELRRAVRHVRISDEIKNYIVSLTAATRIAPGVRLGASPRASLALMRCAQAFSLMDGNDFVTPEAVQEAALPVLAHRLGMERQAPHSRESAVQNAMASLPVPS